MALCLITKLEFEPPEPLEFNGFSQGIHSDKTAALNRSAISPDKVGKDNMPYEL